MTQPEQVASSEQEDTRIQATTGTARISKNILEAVDGLRPMIAKRAGLQHVSMGQAIDWLLTQALAHQEISL